MTIDSHQHFWIFDQMRDTWIDDSMKILQQNFLPAALATILKQNKLDGCVAVQADQSETETLFLLSLSNQHDFIKGVVGWVDLQSKNIGERLHYFSQFNKLKGFRHIVQAEKDDRFLLNPKFIQGIEALQANNFTYDILIYPRQLPAALALVEMFPNQKFIIDHIAKPEIKIQRFDNWEPYIRNIAKHENVYIKVSGLVTEANWGEWKKTNITPYLDIVFESFGSDRVMYGSDWPVCLLAASYERQLAVIQNYISKLSVSEHENIMGNNAVRFYNL